MHGLAQFYIMKPSHKDKVTWRTNKEIRPNSFTPMLSYVLVHKLIANIFDMMYHSTCMSITAMIYFVCIFINWLVCQHDVQLRSCASYVVLCACICLHESSLSCCMPNTCTQRWLSISIRLYLVKRCDNNIKLFTITRRKCAKCR